MTSLEKSETMKIFLLFFVLLSSCSETGETTAGFESGLEAGDHSGYVMSDCFSAGRMRLITSDGWFLDAGPPVLAGYEGEINLDGRIVTGAWLQIEPGGHIISCGGNAGQECLEIVDLGHDADCN